MPDYFMPESNYDLQTARQEFDVIRKLKSKPAQQERAFASHKKQLGIYTTGKQAGCGVPAKEADVALQVYGEFLDLYAELTSTRRSDLKPVATVYHELPASNADRIRWKTVKSKYSNPPHSLEMTASCLMGSEGAYLNDDLEIQHTKALSKTPGYMLEPYWSDIVTVLKTATVCPVTNYSGVIKSGNPPRYFWRATREQLTPIKKVQSTTLGLAETSPALLGLSARSESAQNASRQPTALLTATRSTGKSTKHSARHQNASKQQHTERESRTLKRSQTCIIRHHTCAFEDMPRSYNDVRLCICTLLSSLCGVSMHGTCV